MDVVLDGDAAIREYSEIQRSLCVALGEKYGPSRDDFIDNIPTEGLIFQGGETWAFKKHGRGVEFRRLSNGEVVDAHKNVVSSPECVDAWRLAQYFESRGITVLSVNGTTFDAQDHHSVAELLGHLVSTSRLRVLEDGFAPIWR